MVHDAYQILSASHDSCSIIGLRFSPHRYATMHWLSLSVLGVVVNWVHSRDTSEVDSSSVVGDLSISVASKVMVALVCDSFGIAILLPSIFNVPKPARDP